jgi:AcrR family transcriptional regulator
MAEAVNAAQARTTIEDVRRNELIAATMSVISVSGFDGTTVRDIARAAGASVGSVNYYFASKDDLVRAAVAETDARFRTQVRAAVMAAVGFPEKLACVVEFCFPDEAQAGPDWSVFLDFWNQAARHDDYREIFDEAHSEWIEMLTRVLADGVKDGSFSLSASPRDEALGFAAMIDGLALYTRVTTYVNSDTARRVAKQYIDELRPKKSQRSRAKR